MTPRFCKDCRHYRPIAFRRFGAGFQFANDVCYFERTEDRDPVLGISRNPVDARTRNADMNCPDWDEREPPELIPLPPPEPKRPWWRRLW